jgi:hypothetical protein
MDICPAFQPPHNPTFVSFNHQKRNDMKAEKTTGALFIAGAIGVLVPYIILSITFEYPMVLQQETGAILTKFHAGGASLIWTWWAFAVLGLPLLVAYERMGQKLENSLPFVRWATTFGKIGLIAQMIGLLRWVFVVPVLAHTYVQAPDEASRAAAKVVFQAFHQFGGVLLGEHVGQLFTITWTVLLSLAFDRLRMFPKWVIWLGYGSSAIYLMAQAELFATVIPDFPVWELAGLIGSTLWLVWLVVIGIRMRS